MPSCQVRLRMADSAGENGDSKTLMSSFIKSFIWPRDVWQNTFCLVFRIYGKTWIMVSVCLSVRYSSLNSSHSFDRTALPSIPKWPCDIPECRKGYNFLKFWPESGHNWHFLAAVWPKMAISALFCPIPSEPSVSSKNFLHVWKALENLRKMRCSTGLWL